MSPENDPAQLSVELAAARDRIAALEALLRTTNPTLLSEIAPTESSASQQAYQFIAEHSGGIIWILDLEEMRFHYCSPEVEKLRGYTAAEVLQHPIEQTLTPSSLAHLHAELPQRVKRFLSGDPGAISQVDDFEQPCKNGSTVWIEAATTFIQTPAGKIQILGVSRDISKRKEAEEKFSIAFQNSPQLMAFTDLKANVYVDVNQTFLDTLGYTRAEIIGRSASELNIFASEAQRDRALAALQRDGRLKEFEVDIQTRSGALRHGLFYAEYVLLGRQRLLLTVMSDLTEVKKAETLIHQKNDELILINALNQAVNHGDATDKILSFFSSETRRILKCKDMAIYLLNPERRELTILYISIQPEIRALLEQTIGKSIPNITIPIRPGSHFEKILSDRAGTILQDPKIIQEWMLEFSETPFLSKPVRAVIRGLIPRLFKMLNIRSTISIPLVADDQVIGLLDVASEQLLSEEDLARVQRIAGPVTAAMQRRLATNQLMESENRYRAIFDGATEGIIALNLRTQGFQYINPAICAMFGYSETEFSALTIPDLHPQNAVSQVLYEYDGLVRKQIKQAEMIPCRRKDGSLFYADISVAFTELQDDSYVIGFFNDVTERRRNSALLQARLWLSALSPETSLDDLLQRTLDEAEKITDSRIGFFHFIEEDQNTISLQNWSSNTILHMCSAEGKGQHYPVNMAGVWADALRQRNAVIYNDYPALAHRRGLPTGHAVISRFISIPVLRNDKVVAMIGVGNKEVDYDHRDIEVVTLLANETWDIILRKRAENALLESKELYRTLIESQDSAISVIDRDGTYRYINQKAAAMLQTSPEAIVGRRVSELLEPDYARLQLDAIQRVIASHERMVIEARIPIQGSPRWYRTSIQPVGELSGKVQTALVNAVDITAHKEIELVLEEKVHTRTSEIQSVRQRLELATHSAGIGIWEWNLKTGESIWDEQMFKIYNFPRDKYTATFADWRRCVHPEDLPREEEILATAINGMQEYKAEFRIRWPDLSEHFISSDAIILTDEQGLPERVIGIDFDITARKQAETIQKRSEELLRRANEELARAMRMKDEFLASMSHELRTPLTGILGLSEALQYQTYGGLNPGQMKAIVKIEQSGQHLLNLINDILDVSKIEAGKLELQFEHCSLGEICQSSLQLVTDMAEKKHLHLGFTLNPALISLYADSRRLKQILVNLLSNAIKFTPEGGSLGLEVEADKTAQTIRLTVWDKGIGIAAPDLERLFQPFVQVDSGLARQHTGTGLGLVLVHRLAELHGGSVEMQSELGQGSRFSVLLPWVTTVGKAADPTRLENPFLIQRTLTVEDNEIDAQHLSRNLKILGVLNIVLPEGIHAVQKAIEMQPAVILLDLHMAEKSGWETLQALKANPATSPIPVVITSVEESRARAAEMGAVGYLVKPFTLIQLREALVRAAASQPRPEPVLVIAAPDRQSAIMVVEDNEVNSQIVIDFLESSGYPAVWLNNGWDFLTRAPQEIPPLVLMDIQMPGIDGLETLRRLRAHLDPRVASIPVIAITALAMTGDRERCLAAGANEYISKPFRLSELLPMLQKHLRYE